VDANGRLSCAGWAVIPEENRPADCVVLGFEKTDGNWELFSVSETGDKREDVAARSGRASLEEAGFSRIIEAKGFPPAAVIMRAYAVDLPNGRVFPLAGEIAIPARR
jgi:hypothetical protein